MVQTNASSPSSVKSKTLTLIHFNDVYNVESQNVEPVGGAARFKTALRSFDHLEPLILFSGDIFAPSIMSSTTNGDQMIPVLNQFNVHCSVFGNHDFDFGLEKLLELASETTTPWLMSNVLDKETNRPLAEGEIYKIIDWKGWKIGLIGLVEEEWLETLSTINVDEVIYTDYVDRGRELSQMLKGEGCDYIIALTHMRTPNDTRLAENVQEIDLILGGHDHVYEITKINGKYILKSGTDFREFSIVTLTLEKSNVEVDIEKIVVTSKYEPDKELAEALSHFEQIVEEKMDKELGTFSVDLDSRFSSIRRNETNLGNFICDILMAACNADVCVINSGTFRSDKIHPAGKFFVRDLMCILPMLDTMVVVQVTGKVLMDILENGVSQYPKLEGRFPQVAGIQYIFDPDAPSGSRVLKHLIKVGDEFVKEDSVYRLVTKAYLQHGKDGYHMLTECPVLQDEEQCPMMSIAVQNHFTAIRTKLGKGRRSSIHRQSLLLLSRRHSLIRFEEEFKAPTLPKAVGSTRHSLPHPPSRYPTPERSISTESAMHVPKRSDKHKLSHQDSFQEIELQACKLAPTVDGRTHLATENVIRAFEKEKQLLSHHNVSTIEETDE